MRCIYQTQEGEGAAGLGRCSYRGPGLDLLPVGWLSLGGGGLGGYVDGRFGCGSHVM